MRLFSDLCGIRARHPAYIQAQERPARNQLPLLTPRKEAGNTPVRP